MSFFAACSIRKSTLIVWLSKNRLLGSHWDGRWKDRSQLLSCTSLQSELPERLNNIPEAQMKHFLHSGCLLRSVFEVELKMSSFLYQRNVPRGKIVIQIGSKGRKKRKRGVGADRQNPSAAFCSSATYNLRQDIASRLICHFHIFMVWYLKNLLNSIERRD